MDDEFGIMAGRPYLRLMRVARVGRSFKVSKQALESMSQGVYPTQVAPNNCTLADISMSACRSQVHDVLDSVIGVPYPFDQTTVPSAGFIMVE